MDRERACPREVVYQSTGNILNPESFETQLP